MMAIKVFRFRVTASTDTFTGSLLFKLTSINPNGNYTGSGMLPSDVTSIQIVPILPNGEKAGKDLTVTVEW